MEIFGNVNEYFSNKKIFITGAGTIGSAILKRLLEFNVHSIRILDNCELKLHELKQLYRENKTVKLILGDIRDKQRLKMAIRGVDFVIHTAALKHVSFCEDNPVDAVKTNVIGTQNLIDVCIDENVEKLIYISTDKSVSPINVMGATKLLGERLIVSAANYKGKCRTAFSSVRFGNVKGSSGSVIPIFETQIKNGEPLTITDIDATRFMMEIEDAVNLVLGTIELSRGQEVFILKMPKIKIIDMAKEMNKINDREVDNYIKIGMEPYEKLHEELITKEEECIALENDKLIVIPPKERIQYYISIGFRSMI